MKVVDLLEAAYDGAAGVTATFNKNLLARISRELGGRFDLEASPTTPRSSRPSGGSRCVW